jgi:hypothetical protein
MINGTCVKNHKSVWVAPVVGTLLSPLNTCYYSFPTCCFIDYFKIKQTNVMSYIYIYIYTHTLFIT